jgi:protein-disulfide isomerase
LASLSVAIIALGCHSGEAAKGQGEQTQQAPSAAPRRTGSDTARATARATVATTDTPARPRGASDTLAARADSARVQGTPGAPIWIVEISDFQCPYCRQWHEETYPRVKREVIDAGKARFAYLNLPLPSHRNAWPAAEAAMCAGLQRKFWPMHDALFHSQDRWAQLSEPGAVFDSLATSIGLDVGRLRTCVASKALRPLIQADYDRAVEAGIQSTPTFMVGDARLEGAYPYENFRQAVDAALARARAKGSKP